MQTRSIHNKQITSLKPSASEHRIWRAGIPNFAIADNRTPFSAAYKPPSLATLLPIPSVSLEAPKLIPFQFRAGNVKFPPGKYVIRMLDDSDLTVMEITRGNRSTSALFEVQCRGQLRTGQERVNLQQIRESLLPCQVV
jgi:hypothetical protein